MSCEIDINQQTRKLNKYNAPFLFVYLEFFRIHYICTTILQYKNLKLALSFDSPTCFNVYTPPLVCFFQIILRLKTNKMLIV